ncbi:MAG: hypothetical protein C0506_06120 [Anaerolinea sp.]|nr:hypothetical protein [Anaerolinea sp.]
MEFSVGIAIDEEVRTASGLVRLGLAAVQATGPGNDFYHLPMLLLSQGFERLGKLVLSLRLRETAGVGHHPRGYRHDLKKIVNDVIADCFPSDYRRRPIAEDDLQFLTNDRMLWSFLDVLHTFANEARYWNLDAASNGTTRSCQRLWTLPRDALVSDDTRIRSLLMTAEGAREGYWIMNQQVVILFERFARALSRLFMLGPLGDTGRSLGVPLRLFYSLTDEDLGKRDYRREPWVPAATL